MNESPDGGSNTLTMANIFILLVIDIVFYMILAILFDRVNPGKYGIPKQLRSFFTACKNRNSNDDVEMQSVRIKKFYF